MYSTTIRNGWKPFPTTKCRASVIAAGRRRQCGRVPRRKSPPSSNWPTGNGFRSRRAAPAAAFPAARCGIVIATDRLNRILEIDRDNLTVTVEPGVVANDINEALSDSGLFYAGYPMSLETCFIGGNLAENAGGGKAIKYGVTSRYVLGLEVVTPTGDLVMLGGKLQKDVTGYNLLQLMIGSEGTLGIFTKAILKLIPRPRYQVDLLCLFPDSTTAIQTVPALLTASGITPTSIEYMDRKAIQASCDYLNESIPYENCGAMLLISIDGIDEAQLEHDYEIIGKFCQEHGAGEIYVADNPSTSERIWKIRRNIAEAYNVRFKRQSCEDIVVPPAAIAAIG